MTTIPMPYLSKVGLAENVNNPGRYDVVVMGSMDDGETWEEDSRTFNLDIERAIEVRDAEHEALILEE